MTSEKTEGRRVPPGTRESASPFRGYGWPIAGIAGVFAVLCWGYIQIGSGLTPIGDKTPESAAPSAKEPVESFPTHPADVDEVLSDTERMAQAGHEYEIKCAPCHGRNGEGGIGPNLTDDYWIHNTGTPEDILEAIRRGFPLKGMPAWGEAIPAHLHIPLAAYVMEMRGTDPPNAKPPQGNPIKK